MDRGERKEDKRKILFLSEMLKRDRKVKRPQESIFKIIIRFNFKNSKRTI